jgi:hypothetical protein
MSWAYSIATAPPGNDVVVMLKGENPAGAEIVTLTEADWDTSALLVAVIVNVVGWGSLVGAL